MEISETLYIHERADWRDWLAANHKIKTEIWLVSYLKSTGKPALPYNDAVEEALCFGWIDSIRKKVDHESYAQRYSPRRTGTGYSQTNKERLARLIERGNVIRSVVAGLGDVRAEDFDIPADVRDALQANEPAWTFFMSTSPSYQRIRAAYVDRARNRSAEFAKRLGHLVDMCGKGKQFGYGIEDYY